MTSNNRPIEDPKLQRALNAIVATMERQGFAGAVMVVAPQEAAFSFVLHAPWSAISKDPGTPMGFRIRSLAGSDGAAHQARLEGAIHTLCQLADFGSMTMDWMEQLKAMLRRAGLEFEHTPFNGRPPAPIILSEPPP